MGERGKFDFLQFILEKYYLTENNALANNNWRTKFGYKLDTINIVTHGLAIQIILAQLDGKYTQRMLNLCQNFVQI